MTKLTKLSTISHQPFQRHSNAIGYISIWIYFRLYGICPGDYYRWNWSIYTVYFTKFIQITFQNGKALGMSLSTPAA